MKKFFSVIAVSILMFSFTNQAKSATLFFDDFNNGANPAWGNEVGSWYTSSGVYNAQYPANNPLTYSSVTTFSSLTDFTVDVDINNLSDGGLFLRSSDNSHGILLVTGGYSQSYNGLYWHVLNGAYVSPVYNKVYIPGLQHSNAHITVEVIGNTYNAYVNGELKTTLTDDTYTSGKVALYDYSGQTFDNFQISTSIPAPEPSSMLLGMLAGVVGFIRKKVFKVQ